VLQPLHMLRRIRDDHQLTSTEKLVFMSAVLRTDNATGRVRASQEALAEDANLTRRTVGKVLRSEAAARYFLAIHEGRQLNLTWTPPVDMGTNMGTNMGTSFPPSASASTTTDTDSKEPEMSDYPVAEDYNRALERWAAWKHGT
jgi:hypothetical protein